MFPSYQEEKKNIYIIFVNINFSFGFIAIINCTAQLKNTVSPWVHQTQH